MIPAGVNGQAEFGIKAGLNFADIVMTNYVNPDVESDLTMKLGLHAGFFVNNQISNVISKPVLDQQGYRNVMQIDIRNTLYALVAVKKLRSHPDIIAHLVVNKESGV